MELSEDYRYEGFVEDVTGNFFLLTNNDSSEQVKVTTPLGNYNTTYTSKLYMFKNFYLTQNDVIQLRLKEKLESSGRVGYIFSLSALTDFENTVFDEHSLPFAFSAFENLVMNVNLMAKVGSFKNEAEYSLLDFYDEDLIIVAVCDQQVENVENFSFDSYIYDLTNYGFVYLHNQLKKLNFNENKFLKDQYDIIKQRKHLRLQKNSHLISDTKFLEVLYKDLISEQNHSLTEFYILYQVIELLIDYVLKELITSYISSMKEEITGYKIKEKMKEFSAESYRIKRLLNDFSSVPSWLTEQLIEKLNVFLEPLNLIAQEDDQNNDENTKLPKLLYKFRNNLVHNYRVLHNTEEPIELHLKKLKEINNSLQILTTTLILSFRNPVSCLPID